MITQSIVVGVDGSPESAAAASVGWKMAVAADVPCRLVHAAGAVNTSLAMAGTGVITETLQLAALAGARDQLRASLQDHVPSSVVDAMVVSTGPTGDVLEAVIAETHATMLVLGGKHHSTLGRWLGGSTVQHMVRRLTVPLLVTAGELRIRSRSILRTRPVRPSTRRSRSRDSSAAPCTHCTWSIRRRRSRSFPPTGRARSWSATSGPAFRSSNKARSFVKGSRSTRS